MRRCVFDKAYTNKLTRQMCFGWTLSFNWLINSFSSWANAKSFFSILYYVSVKLEASFINTPIIVIVYGSSRRVVFWGIILIAEIEIKIWCQYYLNYYIYPTTITHNVVLLTLLGTRSSRKMRYIQIPMEWFSRPLYQQ